MADLLNLCVKCLSAAVQVGPPAPGSYGRNEIWCASCGHKMAFRRGNFPLSSADEEGCMAVAKTLPFHDRPPSSRRDA